MSAPEIPEDIRRTAMAVWLSMPETGDDEAFSSRIARAILAERERCTQIAETVSFKDHWAVTTPERWADVTDEVGEVIGQYKVGATRRLDSRAVIADAIRNPNSSQIAVSSADHAQTEPASRSGEESAATNPTGDA